MSLINQKGQNIHQNSIIIQFNKTQKKPLPTPPRENNVPPSLNPASIRQNVDFDPSGASRTCPAVSS